MELTISLPQGDQRMAVVGAAEKNLKLIREALGVTIFSRDGALKIRGESEAVGRAARVLEQLRSGASRRRPVERQDLLDIIASVGRDTESEIAGAVRDGSSGQGFDPAMGMDVYTRGRRIHAATAGQESYLDAMMHHDLTFCTGPAGTGKTFLAVAAAVAMLKAGQARKLVLVRPAVEAGEKLGFLPGDMQQKVNPYLRPLLDALHDMMDYEQAQRLLACDVIEIVPLAFMRGRTLNDAVIILDEGQNTTKGQMMMFLTRLGHGSKMIVTGDTTQIDIEQPGESGLIDAARRLRRVPGVAFVTLEQRDIVRHSLVQRIVEAYGDEIRRGRSHPRGGDGAAGKGEQRPAGQSADASTADHEPETTGQGPTDSKGQQRSDPEPNVDGPGTTSHTDPMGTDELR